MSETVHSESPLMEIYRHLPEPPELPREYGRAELHQAWGVIRRILFQRRVEILGAYLTGRLPRTPKTEAEMAKARVDDVQRKLRMDVSSLQRPLQGKEDRRGIPGRRRPTQPVVSEAIQDGSVPAPG